MQVLLTTLNAKYIHTNLAIRLLYQLNKHREGLEWKEFVIKQDKRKIAEHCAKFDVVAFSCYIWNITQTLEVARVIKQLNPNCKILLGGPEVSYDWQDVIVHDFIDYIITGEGEIPFGEFLNSFPNVEGVPGFVYKKEEKTFHNPEPAIFDLQLYKDVNPFADDPVEELHNKVLYIETSRGCPYKCEFCLASLDNKVRYLPMERIKDNLKFLMDHGRVVKFLDRTFNMKRDFSLEVFDFILQHHKPGNVFQFEITADILHPDIIKFVNEKVPKNLFRFEIGIQSVNTKTNLAVSRKQNFEKTKSIIKAVEDKVELHLDLIVGMALDYWDDTKYSFDEVFTLHPPELQLGFLKFLKGTPVRDKHNEHGFEFDPLPPYQIIRSNYLSKEELEKIEMIEHMLEIYWNKGKAINVLKYISSKQSAFDFFLGLGEFFKSKADFIKHTLKETYLILDEYISLALSNDSAAKDLMALDYFTYDRMKPQILFKTEIEKERKTRLIGDLGYNMENYKFVAIEICFDLLSWVQEKKIVHANDQMIIQYTNIGRPQLIFTKEAV